MKDLWLVIKCTNFSNDLDFVPIFANSKAKVGYYIKNNVDKFYHIFVELYECDKDYGKVRKRLFNKKNEQFYNLKNEPNKKSEFLEFVKEIINKFDDEELIDEFWAHSEGWKQDFIEIKQIKNSTFIDI